MTQTDPNIESLIPSKSPSLRPVSLENIEAWAKSCRISEERKLAFIEYLYHKRYPGKVLVYALCNDLVSLAKEAELDPHLKDDLLPIARFLRLCPPVSWGSVETVSAWLETGPDDDRGPFVFVYAADIAGVPMGIWRAQGVAQASALAIGEAMGLDREQMTTMPAEHVFRLWTEWCRDNQVSLYDLRIRLVARLSASHPSDTGVPIWGPAKQSQQ